STRPSLRRPVSCAIQSARPPVLFSLPVRRKEPLRHKVLAEGENLPANILLRNLSDFRARYAVQAQAGPGPRERLRPAQITVYGSSRDSCEKNPFIGSTAISTAYCLA